MPNYFKQERFSKRDLINSGAGKKVPVCICVDASYSMAGERIARANKGIQDFIKSTAGNLDARSSVDLCVISFSGRGVETQLDFTIVQDIKEKLPPLVPMGNTPMGAAVQVAVKKIKDRYKAYKIEGRQCSKPWLIIMSDGASSDNISSAVQLVRQELQERRIKVQCIGLGDGSELDDLRKFSPNGKVESYDALHIENFFDMLSASVVELSVSAPGDDDILS